ncbi:hypothetical protein [Kosakonia sacchari]|uniref:hypothetical protein n=1 Tax=Kosakonia sacchari TaxID=1158459 RepID=UPI0008075559|nr:hypothetical protein [Kosakonia sacchari]ANR79739.1 hypothetical protein BBB57_16700 [Kosakonia sacchari]MDN2487243.1 hypothetical protein [Kosakonia sacchari]NUL38522.1 hypothetical protein [Kosakonia sacchari]
MDIKGPAAIDVFKPYDISPYADKTLRAVQLEPAYTPAKETFQAFQQRHYSWRTGDKQADLSRVPKDEGKIPLPTLGESLQEIFLGAVLGGPLPEFPGGVRSLPGAGAARLTERPSGTAKGPHGEINVAIAESKMAVARPLNPATEANVSTSKPLSHAIPDASGPDVLHVSLPQAGGKNFPDPMASSKLNIKQFAEIAKVGTDVGEKEMGAVALSGEINIVRRDGPLNDPNMYMFFTDSYKGEPRLNIIGHGVFTPKGDSTTGLQVAGGVKAPFDVAMDTLELAGEVKFKNIRCLSCHSGEGGIDAFAQKLANYTGVPVKGYHGSVTIGGRADGSNIVVIKNEMDALFHFGERETTHYQPQKFHPLWRPWEARILE